MSGPLLDHIHYTQQLAAAADFTGSTDASPAPQNEDADVRLVQTGLAELGYAPGEINGGMNEKTRAAIIQFEEDRGLEPDGDVSPELLAEISKMSGDSSVATP